MCYLSIFYRNNHCYDSLKFNTSVTPCSTEVTVDWSSVFIVLVCDLNGHLPSNQKQVCSVGMAYLNQGLRADITIHVERTFLTGKWLQHLLPQRCSQPIAVLSWPDRAHSQQLPTDVLNK